MSTPGKRLSDFAIFSLRKMAFIDTLLLDYASLEKRMDTFQRLQLPFGTLTEELLKCPDCDGEAAVSLMQEGVKHTVRVVCTCTDQDCCREVPLTDRDILLIVESYYEAATSFQTKYRDAEEGHPIFPKEKWKLAVACGDTTRSYWDWLQRKVLIEVGDISEEYLLEDPEYDDVYSVEEDEEENDE